MKKTLKPSEKKMQQAEVAQVNSETFSCYEVDSCSLEVWRKKLPYKVWRVKERENGRLEKKISSFLDPDWQAEVMRLREETFATLYDIWKYLKVTGNMPYAYVSFTKWYKKFLAKKGKKNASLPSNNVSGFRMDLPIDDSSSGFRMDLPITDNTNENSEKKQKKVQVWHSPYKHLTDDEYEKMLDEKSKALDRQGTEGVFIYDRSQKY